MMRGDVKPAARHSRCDSQPGSDAASLQFGSEIMNAAREVRFALRTLRGAPLVSMLAIACIGLGIGAVTTVYSTANAFTFRPLPQLRDAGRLVLISEDRVADLSGVQVTAGTFGDLRTLPEFSAVGALR